MKFILGVGACFWGRASSFLFYHAWEEGWVSEWSLGALVKHASKTKSHVLAPSCWKVPHCSSTMVHFMTTLPTQAWVGYDIVRGLFLGFSTPCIWNIVISWIEHMYSALLSGGTPMIVFASMYNEGIWLVRPFKPFSFSNYGVIRVVVSGMLCYFSILSQPPQPSLIVTTFGHPSNVSQIYKNTNFKGRGWAHNRLFYIKWGDWTSRRFFAIFWCSLNQPKPIILNGYLEKMIPQL